MVNIDLTEKVTIITGAGSGLGKAIALRFAEAGATVVVADINYDNAAKVAEELEEIGVPNLAVQMDATKQEDFAHLMDITVKEFGKLDIMINNAGIGMMKPIGEFTVEDIDKIVNINLKGAIYGSQAAIKVMLPNKSGKILNVSSIAAKLGAPCASIYAATKSGVMALSNSLAREVAEFNININAICPGIIRTNMWENQLSNMSHEESAKEQIFGSFIETIPMKRPQEPVDIANTALFLCSDLARNITAQTINIDGGSAIH